eukprot:scaffold48_cov311-Pinguiococcus_pyrenoidosus.AAC.127
MFCVREGTESCCAPLPRLHALDAKTDVSSPLGRVCPRSSTILLGGTALLRWASQKREGQWG